MDVMARSPNYTASFIRTQSPVQNTHREDKKKKKIFLPHEESEKKGPSLKTRETNFRPKFNAPNSLCVEIFFFFFFRTAGALFIQERIRERRRRRRRRRQWSFRWTRASGPGDPIVGSGGV